MTDKEYINVAHAIKNAREKARVSQLEMATQLGITRRHYQRLEKTGNFKIAQLDEALKRLDLQLIILPKNDVFAKMAGFIM